ncbi:MAG: putative bifunctional diguanylate cyclase/phosphodiesterase [Bacillota bacterium]
MNLGFRRPLKFIFLHLWTARGGISEMMTESDSLPTLSGFDQAAYERGLKAAGIGMWEFDFKSAHASICANMARVLGMPPRFTVLSPSEWRARIEPVDLPYVEQLLKLAYTKGKPYRVEFRARRETGEIIWLQAHGSLVRDAKGHRVRLTGAAIDITEKKSAEDALRLASERLKLAVEGSGEGIWDYDLPTNMYTLSGGLNEILGRPHKSAIHHANEWIRITHPDDVERMLSALRACIDGATRIYRCEYRIRTRDGGWKWILSRGVVVARDEHGTPTSMAGIVTDVTDKKASEETAWRHANLDSLTGLPNRRHFLSGLEAELRRAPRQQTKVALLFIDLDGFKQVNDLFGHDAGDLLLMEAAYRIRKSIRSSDELARLGGDEFTVLLKDLRKPDHVEYVCQQILASLSKPFTVGSEVAYVSASIGVAIAPLDTQSGDELLRKADTAMYAAKASGKNQFGYFSPSMDEKTHSRLRVAAELRRAISSRQFTLYYQPVIDLHDGHVVKTEALLRWEHPKLGKVAPSIFVPIAEETGLMGDIGNWVFREAATRTKQWSERAGVAFQVALNKSPVQFNQRYMESDWLQYLHELDLSSSSIVVEITEGILLHASSQVADKLLEYRDAGIQVAIDDFGTGYSSLAYLKEFDIDYLKIDQSFIRGIPANPGNCTIAETIIVMAHKLGQKVIAEGIETKEQADFLIQAGCDYGQGFYFAPPVPAEQVEPLLSRRYL